MKTVLILIFTISLFGPSQSCDMTMSYKDSVAYFTSPNYPASLGNGSLICTLKIEHSPSIEELASELANELANSVCGGGNSTDGSGGGSNGDDGSNGGGQNGQSHGDICQVLWDYLSITFCLWCVT